MLAVPRLPDVTDVIQPIESDGYPAEWGARIGPDGGGWGVYALVDGRRQWSALRPRDAREAVAMSYALNLRVGRVEPRS